MASSTIERFQVAHFLRLQPWFQELAPSWQEEVLERSSLVRVRKGDVALPAGEVAQGWYAVLWGCIQLCCAERDKDPSAYLALTAGEWFGEGSVLQEAPRRYEVVALRDSELVCLPRSLFHQLMGASLPFCHSVMRHLNRRLGQAMAIIEASRTGSPEQRLALYLSRPFWNGQRKLHLSQEELGWLAGLSRQTVNRALKGLGERGLVALEQGRVVKVAQEALEEFVAD